MRVGLQALKSERLRVILAVTGLWMLIAAPLDYI
jgi:hypothetical protein